MTETILKLATKILLVMSVHVVRAMVIDTPRSSEREPIPLSTTDYPDVTNPATLSHTATRLVATQLPSV